MPALREYDRPASYYMNQGMDGQPLPTISDRLRSMGMDSSIENRPMIMPVREDGEWIAPEWFHSMARGAMVPSQAVLGGTVTPLDTAMATADYAGGGLLSSKAIPNAVPDGSVLGATVWHGSPHKFDRFDMNKVGIGEGAQAYGHGLYFAESPEVAIGYADRLSIPSHRNIDHYEIAEISKALPEKYRDNDDNAWEVIEQLSAALDGGVADNVDEYLKMYDVGEGAENAYRVAGDMIQNKNNLYKVDLPDKSIETMIDYDSPMIEQTDLVKGVGREFFENERYFPGISRVDEEGRKILGIDEKLDDLLSSETGRDFYLRAIKRAEDNAIRSPEYSKLTPGEQATGFDRLASMWLNDQGVKGLKYFDGNSRANKNYRQAIEKTPDGWLASNPGGSQKLFKNILDAEKWSDKRTRNYVVFDDTVPTILGRD